ncbi:helix-turn-helix transcriptional regulator [Aquimarina sp. U1-2]|uniref:helix-turn-helix domain-containing protein n=1 Tax=Aquimarina sp. U1-2 TaxID=2823141 RepID=UPI001AECC92C|nr:AraC family transcriptional regulator [Aquimarina sp. U1-2]MBP2831635.1 helix-turn-helix transcriptional regulator [Aquimarina sp. U1-2]
MDKKRRKRTSLKTEVKKPTQQSSLQSIIQLLSIQEQCGITSKKFKFLDEFGKGYFRLHHFEGLYVGIFDVILTKDIHLSGQIPKDFLELSFLIEGEQIIKIKGTTHDYIYESQECYLAYFSNIQGSIAYHEHKRLKEIKIRMSAEFIQKHHLDEEYDILNRYTISKLRHQFAQPMCSKTLNILSEILSDSKKGLLKRLFLESKTLELIAIQLEKSPISKPIASHQTDKLVKKLYQVQHLITSDLTIQYSIQQLAREVGLNDFVLKKEFKRIFDKTIFEFATQTRMNKAKQLLNHSKKPIYEISELVGYKNSTHFTAAFKKIEGVTPKKYRTGSEA